MKCGDIQSGGRFPRWTWAIKTNEAIDAFLAHTRARGLSPKTLEGYVWSLGYLSGLPNLPQEPEELELIRSNLPWERWAAVRTGRVFVADGNAYFNRPGPRLVESLEILAACVHPRAFADMAERHAAAVRRVTPDLTLEPLSGD